MCATHNEILNQIQKTVHELIDQDRKQNEGQITSKGELLENSYMFFIANISKKGKIVKIDDELFQQTIIKQLKFHRKLLKLDLNIHDLINA
jgi:hypothetical protein